MRTNVSSTRNKELIEGVVLDSGLWAGHQKSTHGFILSPETYCLTKNKQRELKKISLALYRCLFGLTKIAARAADPKLSHGCTWGVIKRVIRTGIPRAYRNIQLLYPETIPYIYKVDFVEDRNGQFWITEIDVYNKHGLGYSALAARMAKVIQPTARFFPGVARIIAGAVKELNEDKLVLLYADKERFYCPEFLILKKELAEQSINLSVVSEKEFKKVKSQRVFIDLPFLTEVRLRDFLIELYQKEDIKFLIPPKPFLSSKAVLALLKNQAQDKELERILKSEIPSASLEKIRGYIPATYLISPKQKESYWQKLVSSGQWVIKEAFSSGSKGLFFSDEPNFVQILKSACYSGYSFILQERIVNAVNRLSFFNKEGQLKKDKWCLRLTVHFTPQGIADMVVTARQDKRVHGALDCLQIGTVLE
jgi:hypothetical protein